MKTVKPSSIQQVFTSVINNIKVAIRNTEVKRLRYLKAKEGCPLQGFCPYDVNEPFDCSSCPSK